MLYISRVERRRNNLDQQLLTKAGFKKVNLEEELEKIRTVSN